MRHLAPPLLAGSLALLAACSAPSDGTPGYDILDDQPYPGPEAVSLLGEPLERPELDEATRATYEANLAAALDNYVENPDTEGALVWLGRRVAYLGRYREAIGIFSRGIGLYPKSFKLLRHRGHRYITLRRFDLAVRDLREASFLIAGIPDQIEPDGIPNARNQPTSTSHSNIWYHLGLAYYLRGDFDEALRAYRACMLYSKNPDMLCATSHWLFMTLRRLGREEEAAEVLAPITEDLDVIENVEYHELLLLYRGLREPEALLEAARASGGVALATTGYGVGNWYRCNGEEQRALELFEEVVAGEAWPAFGHVAAEADLARRRAEEP